MQVSLKSFYLSGFGFALILSKSILLCWSGKIPQQSKHIFYKEIIAFLITFGFFLRVSSKLSQSCIKGSSCELIVIKVLISSSGTATKKKKSDFPS